jgi:hypothetical protein
MHYPNLPSQLSYKKGILLIIIDKWENSVTQIQSLLKTIQLALRSQSLH